MDAKILFITAVISCSWFLVVSGFPTAEEELGSLETVGNHTDWKIIPRKASSEKRYNKKFWCKPYPRAQIIKMLGASPAAGSYGGYNPQYMALTWEEARKFPNLVTNVSASPRKVSYIPNLPLRDPTRPSILTSRAGCRETEGGCVVCTVRRYLGRHRIPRYINEVTCEQGCSSSRGESGMCKSAVLFQQFFHRTGRCHPYTGYEILVPYTQKIRVCCKCVIFVQK